jgi:CheY-like chemotaxis protein
MQAISQAIHAYDLPEAAHILKRHGYSTLHIDQKGFETGHSARDVGILVVDDAAEILTTMSHLLERDYHVRVASNGARALQIAASHEPPDLILLDLSMPTMDGIEVLTRLKQGDTTRRIPVLMFTANTNIDIQEKAFALGAKDVIEKPVTPPVLQARINTQIEILQLRSSQVLRTIAASESPDQTT